MSLFIHIKSFKEKIVISKKLGHGYRIKCRGKGCIGGQGVRVGQGGGWGRSGQGLGYGWVGYGGFGGKGYWKVKGTVGWLGIGYGKCRAA